MSFWRDVYPKLVTSEFKARYPDVDWPQVGGLSVSLYGPCGSHACTAAALGWCTSIKLDVTAGLTCLLSCAQVDPLSLLPEPTPEEYAEEQQEVGVTSALPDLPSCLRAALGWVGSSAHVPTAACCVWMSAVDRTFMMQQFKPLPHHHHPLCRFTEQQQQPVLLVGWLWPRCPLAGQAAAPGWNSNSNSTPPPCC